MAAVLAPPPPAALRSTKLSIYEQRVMGIVSETRALPEDLALTGRVSISGHDIAKLIGGRAGGPGAGPEPGLPSEWGRCLGRAKEGLVGDALQRCRRPPARRPRPAGAATRPLTPPPPPPCDPSGKVFIHKAAVNLLSSVLVSRQDPPHLPAAGQPPRVQWPAFVNGLCCSAAKRKPNRHECCCPGTCRLAPRTPPSSSGAPLTASRRCTSAAASTSSWTRAWKC
jgi:hypothetical protein